MRLNNVIIPDRIYFTHSRAASVNNLRNSMPGMPCIHHGGDIGLCDFGVTLNAMIDVVAKVNRTEVTVLCMSSVVELYRTGSCSCACL